MIVCEPVDFSGKHSFTLYPSLDPYQWTERQTETEYTATRAMEENFSSCAVVSVFWLWRK